MNLDELLAQSAAQHRHLCPRQVLGVRMGMLAGELLELELPQTNKRLFTFVETDGCFADGIAAATGCRLGRRTMRLIDFGKVAATFVDTRTDRALRIRPRADVRERAQRYAPEAQSRWHAYLAAYQVMPVAELLAYQPVTLTIDLRALISRAGARTTCTRCGEEIINEREVIRDGAPICRGCAGENYYGGAYANPSDFT
jgi:formylmethanofuran dehydrogenase subunit E